MAEYAEAKAQAFRHQKPDDVVFLPADKSFDVYAREAPSRVVRFGRPSSREAKIVKSVKMKLPGEHNRRNAEIATAVALNLGVPVTAIKRVLSSFKGLPNRLETIATIKGVQYVNDTTATTPDATIAAIEALKSSSIHLIFGGADKELEFADAARVIKKYRVSVALLPGTAHAKIVKAFRRAKVAYQDVKDLRDAMRVIHARTKRGDVVLLSPGCASFGLFKNEFDRGEKFKKALTVRA
jgi:UDP-N-acetylmuramoylalanine--D-glutamate ligase